MKNSRYLSKTSYLAEADNTYWKEDHFNKTSMKQTTLIGKRITSTRPGRTAYSRKLRATLPRTQPPRPMIGRRAGVETWGDGSDMNNSVW